MYFPKEDKKLPRKGKRNLTPVTPKFLKFNRQKLEVPKVSGRSLARYHGETLDQRRISFKDRPTSNL